MDGTFKSDTQQCFLDPVALVKYHLGTEAVDYAITFKRGPYETVIIRFPEGTMTAQVSLESQTVKLWLPRWAQNLGWAWECE